MKLKRIFSIFLAVLMVVACLSACKPNGTLQSSSSSNVTTSNQQNISSEDFSNSSYSSSSSLPVGSEADKTEDEFNNTSSESAPKPDDNMTDAEKEASGLYDKVWVPDVENDEEDSTNLSEDHNYNDSPLNEKETFQYLFENDHYAYGITATGSEIIAYKDAEGKYFDVLTGGGAFLLRSVNQQTLALSTSVKSFQRLTLKNHSALIVRYNATGTEANDAVLETTYTFFDESISVAARAALASDSIISNSSSTLSRNFVCGVEESIKNINYDWYYGEDGDFPYKVTESWVNKCIVDDRHTVYTFRRGIIPDEIWDYYVRYPDTNLPLYFDESGEMMDTNTIDTLVSYDLVLARHAKDEKPSDYLALFHGDHSEFAAGIAPVTENTANTNNTLFVNDKVELNLNVTNLVDYDLEFSARYDIRDYYGNIVDAGIFLNSTVFKGSEANRTISVSADKTGYGMYYLNFMVVSKTYTYREHYTFVLLDDYEYKYNKTSPFGIVQFLTEGGIEGPNQHPEEAFLTYENSYDIMTKIGVAATRGAFSNFHERYYDRSIYYLEKLKQAGIRNYSQGATDETTVKNMLPYTKDFIAGNEQNLATFNGSGMTMQECMDDYIVRFFDPAEAITDKYNVNHYIGGVSAGQKEWYDELYARGMWDKLEGISLHTYGIPYSPDSPTYKPYTWSMEGGCIRTVEAFKKYGAKPYVIDETGYSTSPAHKSQCTPRIGGDYNIRTLIIGAYYGADYVGLYSALDFSNSGFGLDNTNQEWQFGQFYARDYFGRILPKPGAAMFAVCTRQLESMKSIAESSKYSTDTLRAFVIDTEVYGKVIACWTRKEVVYTESRTNRDPIMPWQNHFGFSPENQTFEALGSEVIVTDCNGRDTVYKADADGNVVIPITGEVYFIKGVKA